MNLFNYDGWIWVTQDGREINIVDLEDSHLINIMRMLRRRAGLVSFRNELIYFLKNVKKADVTNTAKLKIYSMKDSEFLLKYVEIYVKMQMLEEDRNLNSFKEPKKNAEFREAYKRTLEQMRNSGNCYGGVDVVKGRRLMV